MIFTERGASKMFFKKAEKQRKYDFTFRFDCKRQCRINGEVMVLELINMLTDKPEYYLRLNDSFKVRGFSLYYNKRKFISKLEALKFSQKQLKTILSCCKDEYQISSSNGSSEIRER